MFDSLKEDASVEGEKDSLGGGNFGPWESGVYPDLQITTAYSKVSKGGAMGIVIHFNDQVNQKELRSTLWATSGTAKGCKNFYVNQKGDKRYLPGYETFAAISRLTLDVAPSDLTTEEKTVMLWSYEDKKDVPTQVDMIMPLLGQRVTLGVTKQIVDKNINVNGPGETPNYQPTGETREENEIRKVFSADTGCTTTEVAAGETAGGFIVSWGEKNTGLTIDKSTKDVAPAAPSSTGSIAFGAATAPADAKPQAPIFGGA